jgi:hypothetical protein
VIVVPADSLPDDVVISVNVLVTVPLLMRSLGVRAPFRVEGSRLSCEFLRRR